MRRLALLACLAPSVALAQAAPQIPAIVNMARSQAQINAAFTQLGANYTNTFYATNYKVKCDGSTDDTTALQAFFLKAASNTLLVLPPGTCVFKGALAVPSGGLNGSAIIGSGPYQTVLKYTGASTNIDLLTIGDGTNGYANWYVGGFKITSTTTMTAASGFHVKKLARSMISNLIWDGQDGTGKLYNGAWFDGVDEVFVQGFEARGSNDAIRLNGLVSGYKAGLFLDQGKIASSAVGIRMGGAFGGLATGQVDVISNGSNLVVDTTLVTEANREIFLGELSNFDTATVGDNIKIDDSLTTAMTVNIASWVATGPAAGIDIVHCAGCKISISSPVIWNHTGDGIKNQDPAAFISLGTSTLIHDNGGYGFNQVSVPTTGVITPGAEPMANTSGPWSANAHVENLNASNGYRKDPTGLIHEWGTFTVTGAANTILTTAVTYPLACPNAQLTSTLHAYPYGFANGQMQMTVTMSPTSTTGASISLVASGTVTSAQSVNYEMECY